MPPLRWKALVASFSCWSAIDEEEKKRKGKKSVLKTVKNRKGKGKIEKKKEEEEEKPVIKLRFIIIKF